MNVCHASDTYPIFKATDPDWETTEGWKWKPGIHMSQWIARLWFKVMRVRVEQVNQITDEDAIAEGINLDDLYVPHVTGMLNNRKQETPSEGYQQLFDSIHGPGSFERGDFVWVYDIARITKPHRTNS
jgi:hypothetical protein